MNINVLINCLKFISQSTSSKRSIRNMNFSQLFSIFLLLHSIFVGSYYGPNKHFGVIFTPEFYSKLSFWSSKKPGFKPGIFEHEGSKYFRQFYFGKRYEPDTQFEEYLAKKQNEIDTRLRVAKYKKGADFGKTIEEIYMKSDTKPQKDKKITPEDKNLIT